MQPTCSLETGFYDKESEGGLNKWDVSRLVVWFVSWGVAACLRTPEKPGWGAVPLQWWAEQRFTARR